MLKHSKTHNDQFNDTDLIKKISAWLPCHDMGSQPSGLDPGLLASTVTPKTLLHVSGKIAGCEGYF